MNCLVGASHVTKYPDDLIDDCVGDVDRFGFLAELLITVVRKKVMKSE